MSSSVFIESSSLPADSGEYASTSDSNLVVVYGKNGISFDDKGLENLIEEKKISSISVIRLTSPTPSMKDEEEAEKLEEMLRRQEIGTDDESLDSEKEGNDSSDKSDTAANSSNDDQENEEKRSDKESDNEASEENKLKNRKLPRRRGRQPNAAKQKKVLRRRKRERPEIVGLRLEEFYPPEDANEIIKEALKMAGLGTDKKEKENLEFQLFVIRNDHCYTPFTSPAQMKAKLAADKLEYEKQAANRKNTALQPTIGKQLIIRKKPQNPVLQKTFSLNKPSTSAAASVMKDKGFMMSVKQIKKDPKDKKSMPDNEDCVEDDDNICSSIDEKEDDTAAGEDESDFSGSDESAETDNDRDSDLDFDVNNPKGRKRKVKLLKTLKRSAGINKLNPKSRRFYSQDEQTPIELPNNANASAATPSTSTTTATSTSSSANPSVVQRQKTFVKLLSDPTRITVRPTPSKVLHIGGQLSFLSPAVAALPPIPKKQNENKFILNTTPPSTMTTLNMPHKTFIVKNAMEQKSSVMPSSPQTHKEIIINKVMASPKTKGFTDLNTLIEQTEKDMPRKIFEPIASKSAHTATITSVVTLTPASKVFMPIAMETAAKNQLPAQISIQTHQSSSELEAEHDKQLDLINSIVQDELKKSNEQIDKQVTNINENIPELVKMLESTEKVLVSTKQQQQSASNNSGHQGNNENFINLPSTSSVNSNTVGDIDIANASLLATPEGDDDDHDLPDDILQQVVELIQDDKTLQEAVEKQVFGSGDCNEPVVSSSSSSVNNITTNQNPPPLAPISQQQHVINTNRIQDISHSPKSIIQLAISNLPTSSGSVTKPTTSTTPIRQSTTTYVSKLSPLIRKEPIQIIRGNGRVITLPPIEAPTTRAKRRAQAQPTVVGGAAASSVSSTPIGGITTSTLSDDSMHSNSSVSVSGINTTTIQEKRTQEAANRRRGSKENIHIAAATATAAVAANQKAARKSTAARKAANKTQQTNKSQTEAEAATESEEDDDDPNRLWCICRQPHNNRFMICCDICEDWFHGTCVSITKAMGLEMEQRGIDWTCPKCIKKQDEKTQPKITEMLLKKPTPPTTTINQLELPSSSSMSVTPVVTSITPVVTSVTPVVVSSVPVGTSTAGTSAVTTTTFIKTRATDSVYTATTPQKVITTTHHNQMIETPKLKLQRGQIVNLKDLNIGGTKKAHIIQTSTSAAPPPITAGQKKLYVATTNQPLKLTTQQGGGTAIRTITVVKQISTPQQHHQQHPNIKVIKTISPAQSTTQTLVNTALVNTKKEATSSSTLCIVCKKKARSNSIYCSDDCIRKHAQNALNIFMAKQSQSETVAPSSSTPINKIAPDDQKSKKKPKGLFEDLLSMADRKPKVERVNVYERKSGRVLTGNSAPTISNLKKWLQDNPTFEVIQPGSTQALELEKKQKQRTQHSSSPTITKSATSPPPLKMFPLAGNVTHKSEASSHGSPHHSPQVLTKAKNRSITEFLSSSSTSTSTSTSPRPSTPKQLQKYPQQVSIKPDKNTKASEEIKVVTPKEKPTTTKRQTSTESAGGGGKSGANSDGEPIRLTIRRTLKEQLMLRYKEEISNAGNETTSKDNDSKAVKNLPELTDEEIDEFAKETEQEMYNYFNRDTGVKYKAKYRSLVFNIKDRKNHTLFAKICGKLIEPKQLVRMSPEELASQELAQWREQEAKHQLEMIKKSELDLISCAKNYVLKTHKGEEVIEGKSSEYANVDITIPVEDVVSALNKSDLLESETVTTRKESSYSTHWIDADSSFLSHSILSESQSLQDDDKLKSTSAAYTIKDKDKEREKDKSRDRDRDREKRHKSKDRHRDKSRSRKRSRSHSRSRSRERDRGEKRHKSTHRDDKREREDRGREKERNKDSRTDRDHHHPHHHSDGNDKKQLAEKKSTASSKQPSKQKQPQEQHKPAINPMETYNLIDQILESTKTVEEAANIVSDRDKEMEGARKTSVTPLLTHVHSATSSSATPITTTTVIASSNDQSTTTPVIDITSESDQEPSSTVSIPTPPHDPYSRFIACDSSSSSPSPFSSEGSHRYSITSLWTGNINMVDVTSFQLSLQPIVGTSVGLAKLLPKELDVVGRIGPETVWDYISKIKKSPNKEIVVIRLIPASESETAAYKILYEYLDNRNRLGVIKSTSSQIKDFYIYPLGAGKNIPSQLQPSERVEFYEDPQRPDVLIGIIVRVVIVGGKRPNPNVSQNVSSVASTSAGLSKFTSRSSDIDSFTPPGSPKPKKRRQSIAHKVDEIDIDAIIKGPIVAKTQKVNTPAPSPKPNDADEPYSPGGSSDDDLPLLPVKQPNSIDSMQTAEDELKRKMEEINRQIAAQEMEIAGLLTGEPTSFGPSSSSSKVLANISIPSNLSQILASIKTAGQDIVPPPPPLIGSLVKNPSTSVQEEHISAKKDSTSSSSTSRLAKLSEAELLSMVPDDIVITPSKPARHEEPPPPGV